MHTQGRVVWVACLLVQAAVAGWTIDSSVTLPLDDYLVLVAEAEARDRERTAAAAAVEPSVAEVVMQSTLVRLDGEVAEVKAKFEVEVRGAAPGTVALPVTGTAFDARVEPQIGAALGLLGPGAALVATSPGRYVVTVEAAAIVDGTAGVGRLELAPVVAPVAVTEIDLPADLGWSCPGAVVDEDTVVGERRSLRLARRRGSRQRLEVRREVRGSEAERALARAVVVTIVEVGQSALARHDVVLYEVARGALSEFRLTVPPELPVESVVSDEGVHPPVADGGVVHVQRRSRLQGTGFLAVRSSLSDLAQVSLEPVSPAVEVRARYLAVASTAAAEVSPEPAETWVRSDLGDLPRALHASVGGLDLVAAWRAHGDPTNSRVSITRQPTADLVDQVVAHRHTTTLMTVEGTLLHRDRLTVSGGGALRLRLPVGAALWSAEVDGLAVRPLERDGMTLVPLPFSAAGETVIEVVSVQQQAVPAGRDRLTLVAPELEVPVLVHRWRLLLPEDHRYRWAGGDLRATAGVGYTVGAGAPAPGVSTGPRPTALGGRAALEGQVVDPSGVPLPGVTVTATSPSLPGGPQVEITDADGRYRFTVLPPGTYDVTCSLVGFQTLMTQEVRLRSDHTARVDASLADEGFAESIEVSAEVPMVDTTQTSTGVTISTDRPGARRRPVRRHSTSRIVRHEDRDAAASQAEANQAAADLRQGLVGGVRPVPVTVPEAGKTLILEGALPPSAVTVVIDVKKGR